MGKTRYVRGDAVGGGDGTVDAASGPGGHYAWTWNEFITLTNLPRHGDHYYIKGPFTYTLAADLDFYSGYVYDPIIVEGYYNTPGDTPTGNNRPLFAGGAWDLDLGGRFYFKNFRITTSNRLGCDSDGPSTVVMNCSCVSTAPAGVWPGAFSGRGLWIDCSAESNYSGWFAKGFMIGCVAHDCVIGFEHQGRGGVYYSIAYDCTTGATIAAGSYGPAVVESNTFYNMFSRAVYIRDTCNGPVLGNEFDTCPNAVVCEAPAGRQVWLDFNNYEYIGGASVVNCSKGTEQTTDDPGLFNVVTGHDFRIGPNIKGQGFPKWEGLFSHILDRDLEGWADQGALQRRELIGETSVDRETGAQARGGTGSCVKFAPSSILHPQVWVFQVPCGSGVSVNLVFWHKVTSGFNGSLTFSASGSGITPIVDSAVPLTDDGDYHLYISDPMTPSQNGYVTIALKARDGPFSGNIFIDDIDTQNA